MSTKDDLGKTIALHDAREAQQTRRASRARLFSRGLSILAVAGSGIEGQLVATDTPPAIQLIVGAAAIASIAGGALFSESALTAARQSGREAQLAENASIELAALNPVQNGPNNVQ